jgi:hypothetical protein
MFEFQLTALVVLGLAVGLALLGLIADRSA